MGMNLAMLVEAEDRLLTHLHANEDKIMDWYLIGSLVSTRYWVPLNPVKIGMRFHELASITLNFQ